ncbi:MAG: hypothetical protein HKN82_08015 [Akkermansiaceae bacterium]|nr:hypothetical protein [Akkermansiaceae bacterium]
MIVALLAAVPAAWLAASFAVPSDATDAYVPPRALFNPAIGASPQIRMALVLPPPVDELP